MSHLLAVLVLLQQDPTDVLRRAEQLIEARETAGNLERAITLLGSKSTTDPSLPLLIALAKAQALLVDTYDLGNAVENQKHKEHREAGKLAANQALAIDPQSGPAHYWLGVLLLFSSDGEQSYSVLKRAVKELEKADKQSPEVDDAGPARMLGRVYQQTPGWPLLGSTSKSIEYLERACKEAPENPRNKLWLGLSYELAGKTKQAREQLELVAASKTHPGREHEEDALKAEAAEHLKGLAAETGPHRR